ncbi:uncharacterized protein E5676_scaffold265G00360 [Cucumis melo var. makuwa]|uniref:DUF4218 domain-containing protein n=1 Tax=Cucumis melo var. makuwa TaxID=1194695 RepID=A0A5D3C9L1_CUCMM|nr:uncharacterized protein E5676_scaffold265G00360 [Cucumis melo var. makuwa]
MYYGEPTNLYRGIERFDERTSSDPFHEETSSDPFHIEGTNSNTFSEDNEMLGELHDLQAPIEHEEETAEEGLENDMLFNNGVEEETANIFQKLLNQAHRELYPDCSKFSSLNFLVMLMHVKRGKILHKVLWYFSLIPRLQRLFVTQEDLSEMRWHKDKQVETDDVLRHPADVNGWNTAYTMWLVVLIPYNLPPWKCMKEFNFFMSLLIPGGKISGLKTYDCHVLLHRLLPIGIRAHLTPKNVYTAVIELCSYFHDLCMRTIREAKVVGPFNYSWMYSIERSLLTLKQYVRNKARPEGSIVEAYVMNESSTFYSRYLSGIETRLFRDERNDDSIPEDEIVGTMSNLPAGFDKSDDLFNFNVEVFNIVLGMSSVGNTSRDNVTPEYIELVKGGLQQWFVLDFTDPTLTLFVVHQMLIVCK